MYVSNRPHYHFRRSSRDFCKQKDILDSLPDQNLCDIVLANSATKIFASSCMDFPYDYNLVNNGFVQEPNLWLKHLNYQDCVLHDEIEINQTPPTTLKSFDDDDDNKREGFPGGWFADWTTSDLTD